MGGIGPESSELLLKPILIATVNKTPRNPLITTKVVSGMVRAESLWDAGAVGYTDERDVGLAQINAEAHPTLSTDQRLTPEVSFAFICTYLTSNLAQLGNNLRDAIAAYNLGVGGTRAWIKAGRPAVWTPPGTRSSRKVKEYIDKVLAG